MADTDSVGSGKKRKHTDEKSIEESKKKEKMSLSDENTKKLQRRIRTYLVDNSSQLYVDVPEIANFLHGKYSEYQRHKRKTFRRIVEDNFNALLEEQQKDSSAAASGDERKSPTPPSSSTTKPPKSTPTSSNNVNKSISDLYAKDKSKSQKDEKPPTSTPSSKPLEKANDKKADDKPEAVATKDKPVDSDIIVVPARDSRVVETVDLVEPSPVVKNKLPENPAKGKDVQEKAKAAKAVVASSGVKQRSRPFQARDSTVKFAHVAGMDAILMDLAQKLVVVKWAGSGCRGSQRKTFLFHGPTGCGKTLLANAVAGQLGWPMFDVMATEIVSGVSGESEQRLRDLFDEAAGLGSPCVLFMDQIEAISSGGQQQQRSMEARIITQLRACLDRLDNADGDAERPANQVIFIGATTSPESLDLDFRSRFQNEVAIGIPDEKSRRAMLERLTAGSRLEPGFDLGTLARNTPSYVGRDFKALVAEAESNAWARAVRGQLAGDVTLAGTLELLDKCQMSGDSADVVVTIGDFDAARKVIRPAAKREGFATVPDVTWDDVGALTDVRRRIELGVLARVANPEKARAYKLDAPTGVLLCGPPGCGKTLVAKAVANQAGINFISVKGPELMNMYVGESEKAVRQVFQRAKNSAPCVVFFDEIDALCPRRSGGSDHSGSNRVVTQMLTELDGVEDRKGVYVMAATNRKEIIDPAILRPGRLETSLYVGLPDPADRLAILKTITRNGPALAADVDIGKTAEKCDGYSGADLKALVTKAAELAFSEDIASGGRPGREAVSSRHFDEAFNLIQLSVQGSEKRRYDRMEQRLNCPSGHPKINSDEKDPVRVEESDKQGDDKNEDETLPVNIPQQKSDGEKVPTEVSGERNGESAGIPAANGAAVVSNDDSSNGNAENNSAENGNGVEEENGNGVTNGHSAVEDVEMGDIRVLRFLPGMAVRVKDSVPDTAGLLGHLTAVDFHEKKCSLKAKKREGEISLSLADLEPFMPSPGEKAKLLVENGTEALLDVIRLDPDNDDSVVVTEKADDGTTKETSYLLENLCRIEDGF